MYGAGLITLPFDLDIFAPSRVIMPWVKSALNGSGASISPMSDRAFVKNRAYIRWRIACSPPPMYWSTGIHWASTSLSHGASSLSGSQYRRKYHEESTKVSIVSVSRSAGPPQRGHVV